MEDEGGIGVGDVPDLVYEQFLQAAYVARAEADPADNWDGFVSALWPRMVAVFDAYELAGVPRVPEGYDGPVDPSDVEGGWALGAD